ncbi:MAG: adenylate/guanylate cyclase domain-containing protein [Elusimicrobia bacterium]|nr:adenylate/guanylate cyclase domain-containing protein [Elusimicrobiota bacterium]
MLGALFIYAVHQGTFEPAENRWQDQLHVWRGIRTGDQRVVIVTIDDKSIQEIGQFPWPRSTYAPLITELKKFGAKVIAFDVLFVDPSREAEDKALVAAVKKAGNVVLAAGMDETYAGGSNVFLEPWDELKNAAKALGLVYTGFCLDADGAVRRVALMVGKDRIESCVQLSERGVLEQPDRLGALGTVVASLHSGTRAEDFIRKFGIVINLDFPGERMWVEKAKGVMMQGKPLMVEKHEYGFRRISAIDVIRGELSEKDRESLNGAMALVGATAQGTHDAHPTPFGERTPGVEVHAATIDNLLRGRPLREVPEWFAYLAPLLMILLADLIIRLTPLSGSLIVVGTAAAWTAVSYSVFEHGYRLPVAVPNISLGVAYFVMLTQRIVREHQEKRWVRDTFAQYLSPKVIEVLANDPEKLKLGGDSRDMSIFFLDIAGFTSIAERMDAKALSTFLNHYLTALTNVILRNDGVVDKYIGDCIMAFWNAPMDQPRHREFACLSALECLHEAERVSGELKGSGIKEKITIRVGVNSGHAVVGNMGSDTRFSYTVIGDAVNVASRLEGANKFFGSHIMASEEAMKGCLDKFETKELGRIRVVGKDVPLRVYDILERAGKLAPERKKLLDLHHAGLANWYDKRFREAAKDFERLLELDSSDKTAKLYLGECKRHLASAPAEFDGVFNLSSK